MKGMIVYGFGWRKDGHSPPNVRLALAAKQIVEAEEAPVLIFAQRTVAKILRGMRVRCSVVEKRSGYEGSEEATRQAVELFRKMGIKEVIVVSHPIIHLAKCIKLIRAAGFRTKSLMRLAWMIGRIGFDWFSDQWQTRSLSHEIFYVVRQLTTGYRPPPEQSEP